MVSGRGRGDIRGLVLGVKAGQLSPGDSRERAPGLLFARLAQYFGEPTEPVVCFSDAGPWGDTSFASLAPSIREPLLGYASRGFAFRIVAGNPYASFYLQAH